MSQISLSALAAANKQSFLAKITKVHGSDVATEVEEFVKFSSALTTKIFNLDSNPTHEGIDLAIKSIAAGVNFLLASKPTLPGLENQRFEVGVQ